MQRVGLIFNQSTCEKEYIMNDEEVYQTCELSAQVGEHCVVAVFSMLEEDGQVRGTPRTSCAMRSTNTPNVTCSSS